MEITNGMLQQDVSMAGMNNGEGSDTLLRDIQEMRDNGQVGTEEFVSKMRQLEILLGISQISPFGTNELEIFEQEIKEMSMSELQTLARKVGVNPFFDRLTLKKNLVREFTYYTRNSRRNIIPSAVNSFVPDPNNPAHDKLIKILNDI